MASIRVVADKTKAFTEVVVKGSLKRSTDLLGLWGSLVGHSTVISCDCCGQENLPMFMELTKKGRQTHLCMDCVAQYTKVAYSLSSLDGGASSPALKTPAEFSFKKLLRKEEV